MGYYNPIYIYGVDKFLADAKAAGVDGLIVVDLPPEEDAELCLPALQGRLQFHPSGDADHRRQAAAGRAHQHVGLRLLRLDHRHHRRRGAGCRQGRAPRSRASSATPSCRSASASACAAASRRARSREAPTASWSVRRWSRRCARVSIADGKPTPATVPAVTELVRALAEGVRGPRGAFRRRARVSHIG